MTAEGPDTASFYESLAAAGYAYDPVQDIFYSVLDPWQRKYGYCRLYDDAAPSMSMIVDCEPVHFEYEGKRWLIEFWKGQYGMTTGGEIGIYNAEKPDKSISGIFTGTFYKCAEESDYLKMYFFLIKNGEALFTRKATHWWLTGFRLGEFSEPSQLNMYICMALKDSAMRDAFLAGMRVTGYSDHETAVNGNIVCFLFSEPHSPQPLTRTKMTDALVQIKNKVLCDQFMEITSGCTTLQEKLDAVKEKAPGLYELIIGLGRPKGLYKSFEDIWGAEYE